MKKKEMSKRGKLILILFSVFITILLITTVSAESFWDWIKKTITGKSVVDINISIGAPSITHVYNETMTDLTNPTEAITSNATINFTAYTEIGASNLNDSTAKINFTHGLDDFTRVNSTCEQLDGEESGNYANYTCNVTMWWWDCNGTWNITAYIEDNDGNQATNTSRNFQFGTITGFAMAPGNLTWGAMAPGSTNQTPTNNLLLNNTGNQNISSADLQVNATNLTGETTATDLIPAENFSVSYTTAATDKECGAGTSTAMVASTFTAISIANLSAGNYTINDKNTGQEQLYVCIREINVSLSSQAYSTKTAGAWTVKIE